MSTQEKVRSAVENIIFNASMSRVNLLHFCRRHDDGFDDKFDQFVDDDVICLRKGYDGPEVLTGITQDHSNDCRVLCDYIMQTPSLANAFANM